MLNKLNLEGILSNVDKIVNKPTNYKEVIKDNMFLKKGTLVQIIDVKEIDLLYGINKGDLFEVIEGNSATPYCKPVNSNCAIDKYSFILSQLEEVK